MKNILSVILFAFLLVFASSCKKDSNSTNPPTGTLPDYSTKVRSSASGFVTNENNLPVEGAIVHMGISTTTTDTKGYFNFSNVEVVKQAATVSVEYNGYFKGIKTFIAEEGKSAIFRLKLLRKNIAGTFTASAGGNISLTNGLQISFPVNAIKNAATGATYNGVVSVAAQWIDPTSSELYAIMPGDLRAVNANGFMNQLTTFGMAAVELTGAGGELLQIADGKTANLKMNIPSSIAAQAPASIPLWYFDELKGLWIEEGSATKTGNTYSGSVNHFSFWNADVGYPYVFFNATITNITGMAISNALIKIYPVNNPSDAHYGYTNMLGYISGAVPSNAQLVLEVMEESGCATTLFTQNFTTTTINISLGNIALPAGATAEVSGQLVDCNGAGVANGSLLALKNGAYLRFPVSNTGNFSFATTVCNTGVNISLTGQDLTSATQSNTSNINLIAGTNPPVTLTACTVNLSQFVNYTVNGNSFSFTQAPDNLGINGAAAGLEFFAYHVPDNNQFTRFKFSNAGIGANTDMNLQVFNSHLIANPTATPFAPITVRITEYGPIGGYIAGSFSGQINNTTNPGSPYTVSCSFRVLRWF